WYLNYDARYALLWARDVWHGFAPDFGAGFAPTPHPLSTLVSSLGLPFGHSGDAVVVWIVLLSFAALVWLTYRLGTVLFSSWVGGAAAIVVLTRPVLGRGVLLAYQDVPFAALIVGAVLLEAQQRRRGVPVLALLTLAGLLRPEAWVLAGLYVVWMWPACVPRQRLRLVGLALVAPVAWALIDLIVTGDPLHSLHGTAALADEVNRRRSVGSVPHWTLTYFAFTLREPISLGIPVGLLFAARHCRRRAALTATDHRPIPYIRWWLDGDPGSVGTVENGSSPLGRLLLTPRRTRLTTRFYQENFPRYKRPSSYRILYQNHNWRVYAAAGC